MARRYSLLSILLVLPLMVGALASTSTASEDGARSISAATTERAVRQKATLRMHPQIAQPGARPTRAASAKSAMTVSFKPRAKGRLVTLQRKNGRRWVNVARARQSRAGVVEFTAPYAVKRKVATYRAVAARHRRLKPVASRALATSQAGRADFTDEFGGSQLGSAWSHRGQDYQAASRRTCSKGHPDAVSVGGGTVGLSVENDPDRPSLTDELSSTQKCEYAGDDYEWRINGHVGTQGQESFKYGYAAARVRFQPQRGQHGAFWLMPDTETPLAGPARDHGAEIDVIEWFGGSDKSPSLASFIHHAPRNGVDSVKVGGRLGKTSRYGKDWAGSYHVFSVEWTPKQYIFRIDGKETFRTGQGVSGQPQYLILSMLSSDNELAQLGGERKLRQKPTMDVDWVRYWER